MRIEYHRTLIADGVRNAALFAALKQLIRPGESIVADIGAGTGLLAVMASRLGAKAVYLYEAAETAAVAAKVIRANRLKNCELFACRSTEFADPPQADVVVSETLGNYAIEEDIIETMADARARHLKPGGALIPSHIVQHIAPVTSPRFDTELRAWDRVGEGLPIAIDLAPARTLSLNNIYVRTIAPADLLGADAAAEWDRIPLGTDQGSTRKGEAAWTMRSAETIYGLALWWTAQLAPGVLLSTAPEAPATHWEQLYLPFLEPVRAGQGETLTASIRSCTTHEAGTTIRWTASLKGKDGAERCRQSMDLEKGYLP